MTADLKPTLSAGQSLYADLLETKSSLSGNFLKVPVELSIASAGIRKSAHILPLRSIKSDFKDSDNLVQDTSGMCLLH